jgi:acetoin utilization deacetylase AcuC-like enzyme
MYALYSDHYVIDLPPHHTFPIQKYRLIREQLVAEGTLSPEELLEPTLVAPSDVRLVHTADYWDRLTTGTLSPSAVRRMGLPWSEALVRRSRASVQGTLTSARIAIRDRIAFNLAGGTHHAFPDRGEGYCVLNDVAIAIRSLQRDGWMQRMAILDCDIHQGNGTAAIFADEPDVYTFSIHGANNYPLVKVPGSLDIGLPDGTRDDEYLAALETAVPRILEEFRPGLVFYVAGADPHEGDRLGRLRLTHQGLRRRDEFVLRACRDAGIPVAVTLGGGYGQDIRDTVEAHCGTVRAARAVFDGNRSVSTEIQKRVL